MCDRFRVAPARWLVNDGVVNPSDGRLCGLQLELTSHSLAVARLSLPVLDRLWHSALSPQSSSVLVTLLRARHGGGASCPIHRWGD